MDIAVFSSKSYDEKYLNASAQKYQGMKFRFFEARLGADSASLAKGADAVCAFVNDKVTRNTLEVLRANGVKFLTLRCAGFNNVDLRAAKELGIRIFRVPAYSPHAAAEHTLALALTLNRKIHRSYNRVREGNFSLQGLLGFDMNQKTVGIMGGGKIGLIAAGLFQAFSCEVIVHEKFPSEDLRKSGVELVDLEDFWKRADILSLHVPLTKETKHIVDDSSIKKMKDGVMLINTSRGALLDTPAVIRGLKSKKIGYLGIDVYEEEEHLFFDDHSEDIITDDDFSRLLTFPNVLVTGHQAFFTETALQNIADRTTQTLAQVGNMLPESDLKQVEVLYSS